VVIGVGSRNGVLDGVDIPDGERAVLESFSVHWFAFDIPVR